MNLSELISFKKGRMSVINTTHTFESFQHNPTPLEIVDKMIAKTSLENKKILVIFNLEFLERLIHKCKIDPANIHFLADSKVEKLTAEKVYKVNSTMATEEEFKTKTFISRIPKMKFDLVFSNPPYNRGADLKILQALKSVATEMIIVHPSTWLIDLKGKSKLYNDFKKDLKLKSVEMFNGNHIFNISLYVPCSITHISKRKLDTDDIDVIFFKDCYKASKIDDITKFSRHWMNIVSPMITIINKHISVYGNVWTHNKTQIDNTKFHCQFAAIRGHEAYVDETMWKDDFYTLVLKQSDKNKGIRQSDLLRDGNPTPTFEFKTEAERDYFLNYCKTDFARFCLALLKNSQNTSVGEMELIPWLDFTQEWNDEKLFKFFNIDQETQDYIRNFLPDYYGIRNKDAEIV